MKIRFVKQGELRMHYRLMMQDNLIIAMRTITLDNIRFGMKIENITAIKKMSRKRYSGSAIIQTDRV